MPPDIGLNNAIRELTAAIKAQAGVAAGVVGGSKNIVDPSGVPVGGKNLSELMAEQIEGMKELTATLSKSTKDQKDTFTDHARKVEMMGAVMAAITPMVQQYAKYAVTRPYELLGGTAGQVGRGMLEREKDAGQIVTGIVGLLATAIGGAGAGLVVAGLGAAGGSQIIGRSLFQDKSITAGAMQTVAQMSQERIPGFRESAMMQYGLMKQDVALLGMGGPGGRGTGMAAQLTALGFTGQESTELIARAVSAGGAQGFRRLEAAGGAKAITDMVNKGIYGTDAAAIAVALATGLRVGFSKEMMEGASRRTGLQIPEIAQAAMMARAQTYLAGPAAGNRLFNMASNTQMARDVGMSATMGAITGAASGASASAEGDEASSMLLYRQFLEANPGSTYLDFVEARRNKETDPRWLKTVGGAARNFSAMGQTGRILGGSLLGTKPMMVEGTATLMDQALGGGIGELTKENGLAGLAKGARELAASDLVTTLASATKFQAKYGEEIKNTTDAIKTAAGSAADFNQMLKDMAGVMDEMTRNSFSLAIDEWIRPYASDREGDPGQARKSRR
jgi:hypothetical protein